MLPLNGDRYVLKRQLLRLFGKGFGIYDERDRLVLQADETPFRWREEIRMRGGYGVGEVLGIFGQNVRALDFLATYDVVDLAHNVKIGALRRQWVKSMVRDEWTIMDLWNNPIGAVIEDSVGLALLRRLGAGLVPQNYDLIVGGQKAVDLRQNFNPFTYHLGIDFLTPPAAFDRRLGLAAAVLLGAVEGRQGSEVGNLARDLPF